MSNPSLNASSRPTGLLSLPTEIHLLILSFLRKAWVLRTSFWELTEPEIRLNLRLTCRHFYNLISPPTLLDLRWIEYLHRNSIVKELSLRLCSKCSRLRRLCKRQAGHPGIIGAPLCQDCDDIRVERLAPRHQRPITAATIILRSTESGQSFSPQSSQHSLINKVNTIKRFQGTSKKPGIGLMSLPPDLHLQIVSATNRWDSFEWSEAEARLNLRLTCRYFYNLIRRPTLQGLRYLDMEYYYDNRYLKGFYQYSYRLPPGLRPRLCIECLLMRPPPMFYLEQLRWSRSKDKFPYCVECKPEQPPFPKKRHYPSTFFRKGGWRTEQEEELGDIGWRCCIRVTGDHWVKRLPRIMFRILLLPFCLVCRGGID